MSLKISRLVVIEVAMLGLTRWKMIEVQVDVGPEVWGEMNKIIQVEAAARQTNLQKDSCSSW